MNLPEPLSTAAYLAVLGLLLALAVASSRLSTRAGVPAILVFLVVGIMAGSEGIGGIHFSDYQLAFRIGTVALAMILFDGGLNTSADLVRRAAAPAGVLATLGVLLTALLVARPLAVAICLSPFRFGWREQLYVGWVGLRGAVPIILASFPLMAGIDAGLRIFNVVFFVVLVSVLLQGSTTRLAGRLLRVERPSPPFPPAVLEIHSGRFPREVILSFFVRPGLMVVGARVGGLPLPGRSAVILIIRGDDLLAPRDDLPIEAGDHVYLLCDPHDRTVVRLLFGHEEEDER